jgi:hypothetical protein
MHPVAGGESTQIDPAPNALTLGIVIPFVSVLGSNEPVSSLEIRPTHHQFIPGTESHPRLEFFLYSCGIEIAEGDENFESGFTTTR